MSATKTSTRYAEDSIKVLKGLEPVRQRPGMYTSTGAAARHGGRVDCSRMA